MKIAVLLSLLTLVISGNSRAQSLENITEISLTKQTRGILDEVVISRDSVRSVVENHRVPENSHHYAKEIDQDQWATLMLALSDVPLHDIDGLQSPTTGRAHDGAVHSTITITFENGESIYHSFDDVNPHPDLQPLLDAILAFRVPER